MKINSINSVNLIDYGGLVLLEQFYDDKDKIYISILVDVHDDYDTYLVSEVNSNDLNDYKNSVIDLRSLVGRSYKWYLCNKGIHGYNITHEYISFNDIPEDYLPESGFYNKAV